MIGLVLAAAAVGAVAGQPPVPGQLEVIPSVTVESQAGEAPLMYGDAPEASLRRDPDPGRGAQLRRPAARAAGELRPPHILEAHERRPGAGAPLSQHGEPGADGPAGAATTISSPPRSTRGRPTTPISLPSMARTRPRWWWSPPSSPPTSRGVPSCAPPGGVTAAIALQAASTDGDTQTVGAAPGPRSTSPAAGTDHRLHAPPLQLDRRDPGRHVPLSRPDISSRRFPSNTSRSPTSRPSMTASGARARLALRVHGHADARDAPAPVLHVRSSRSRWAWA